MSPVLLTLLCVLLPYSPAVEVEQTKDVCKGIVGFSLAALLCLVGCCALCRYRATKKKEIHALAN